MNGLDLFSGIGGIGCALDEYVHTVAYCERDRYAQAVLLSRMADQQIPCAPIWDDVTTLKANMLPKIDIIFGGFPCQDISVAGSGAGLAGKRSGLFYEIIRLTKETSAPFVFLENVPAIRTRGLREVLRAFTEIGYDCRWTCISAASVGAHHKRNRWFLLAYANSLRKLSKQKTGQLSTDRTSNSSKNVSDSKSIGLETKRITIRDEKKHPGASCASMPRKWSTEPAICRVVNGLPFRVDRIKCLGNSVVPIQVKTAFERLVGI